MTEPGINLYPPSEPQRIANRLSATAQQILRRQLAEIFGRWPSMN